MQRNPKLTLTGLDQDSLENSKLWVSTALSVAVFQLAVFSLVISYSPWQHAPRESEQKNCKKNQKNILQLMLN